MVYCVGDSDGYLTLHHPGTPHECCATQGSPPSKQPNLTVPSPPRAIRTHPEGLFRVSITRPHKAMVTALLGVPRLGLVSGCIDGTMVATDVSRAQVVRTFEGHRRGVRALQWCSTEKFMVSAGHDRRVKLWDPVASRHIGDLGDASELFAAPVADIAINTVHNQVVCASEDGKVRIWDIRTMRCVQSVVDDKQLWVTGAAFDLQRLSLVLSGKP